METFGLQVGKKAVCVDAKPKLMVKGTHPTWLKEGQIYQICGMKVNSCCGMLVVDVGQIAFAQQMNCSCGGVYPSLEWWLDAKRFRPVDYDVTEQLAADANVDEIPNVIPTTVLG